METLVKTIVLENQQRLDIYDASVKIAGDRWQVTLVGRMEITIKDLFPEDSASEPPAADIQLVLGDTVSYEIKKQRNFIGQAEKPVVFSNLLEALTQFAVPYLSRPAFPKRFVLKKYRECKSRLRR